MTVFQTMKVFKHSQNFRKHSLFREKKNIAQTKIKHTKSCDAYNKAIYMYIFIQQYINTYLYNNIYKYIYIFIQPNNLVLILTHCFYKKFCLTTDVSFILNSSKSNK